VRVTYAEHLVSRKAGCLGAWCLLTGPEHHLKREALAWFRGEADAASRGGELTWELLDGPGTRARDLLSRGQTVGLFGGARVIVVTSAERMDADEQRALAKGVGPLPPEVGVILVTTETAARGRRRVLRADLERAVDAHGTIIEFPALSADRAAQWAVGHAKDLGKELEVAAARKLAQQKVGTSLAELALEVEKLAAFVGEGKVITSAHVDEVTPRLIEEDIFRLVDAMANQQTGRAVGILRALLRDKREHPIRIIAMLAQAIREIWQTKLLLERGWKPGREADAEAKELLPQDGRRNVLAAFARRSWLVERRLSQAKVFSWSRLSRALHALHGCDLAVKGIEGRVDEDQGAVELLVVQLCTDLRVPFWHSRSGEGSVG